MSGGLQKAHDVIEEKLIFDEVGKALSDKSAALTKDTFAFQNLKSLTERYQREYDRDTDGATPKCKAILSQCHYYLALCFQRMHSLKETFKHFQLCVLIQKTLTSYTISSQLALLTMTLDAYTVKWDLSDGFLARLFTMREKMGVFYKAVHQVYKLLLPDEKHASAFLRNYVLTSARLYYITGLVQCGLGQFEGAADNFQQACLKLKSYEGNSMLAMATYGFRRCLDLNKSKIECEEELKLTKPCNIHRSVIDNAITSYKVTQSYEAYLRNEREKTSSSVIAPSSILWFFSDHSGSEEKEDSNSDSGPRKRVRTSEPSAGAGAG